MKNSAFKFLKSEKGQAIAEFLLSVPLLMLLAAGMIQFGMLLLAKIHFDYACGESARSFALHQISSDEFTGNLWDRLSPYQSVFEKGSIQISTESAQSFLGGYPSQKLDFLNQYVKGSIFDYGGPVWIVTINCKLVPLFGVFFPTGIPFQTQLAVLRHPQ
jgi:hypothetical protein